MSLFFMGLMVFATVAYALIAGAFLAFSDFIMRSLATVGGTCGMEVMQAINREVYRFVFMTLFLGLIAVSLAIIAYAATALSGAPAIMIILAGIFYLAGCVGVTAAFNVPMNEALAKMDPADETARVYWRDVYLPRWTAFNTVRMLACVISAILLLCGVAWLSHSQI